MTHAASRGGLAELVRVGDAVAVRHLDDLEAEAGREGLHDLAHLRVQRLGEDDARAAGHVLRDVAGVRRDRRAVVARGVRDVHPGQLADRGLVLEDRLEHALAHLGLVRRVARSGTRRAGGRRRRPPARSGRRCPRRGTRAPGPCGRSARRAPRGGRRSPARRAPARGRARGRSERPAGCREELLDRRRPRSPRASPRGRALSARGSSLLGDEALVGRQRPSGRPTSAGVAQADADEPALAVRILVHGLRLVDDLLVDLEHLARERRDQVRDRLHRLDLAVGRALRDLGALLGRLEVDELAERVLREPGDAERSPRRPRCGPSRAPRCSAGRPG